RSLARRNLRTGLMGRFNRGLIVGKDAGLGKNVGIAAEVTGAWRLKAVLGGKALDYLGAAAMAVHVSKSADVHEDVKAERGPSVEGAKKFVMLAAVTQAQVDDFGNARRRHFCHKIANLPVGVVAG